MRRPMRFLLTVCTLLALAVPAHSADGISVRVGESAVAFDTAPYIEEGRTLVPLRAIADRLGFEVGWMESERKVTLTKDDVSIALWLDRTGALINGREAVLDVAPRVRNGRTYVPVRFLAETLGARVGWDGGTNTVSVAPGAARALLDKLMQQQKAGQDLMMTGKMQIVVKMMAPGQSALTMEMPMSVKFQSYKGDLLSQTVLTLPIPGQQPRTQQAQLAFKGGTLHVVDPATGKWRAAGQVDPAKGVDLSQIVPGATGSVDPLKLQTDLLKGAVVTFGQEVQEGGVMLSQVNLDMGPGPVNDLVQGLLKNMPMPADAKLEIKTDVRRFRLSYWFNAETGTVVRQGLAADVGVAVTVPGQGTVNLEETMTGRFEIEPLTAPIQFPDFAN